MVHWALKLIRAVSAGCTDLQGSPFLEQCYLQTACTMRTVPQLCQEAIHQQHEEVMAGGSTLMSPYSNTETLDSPPGCLDPGLGTPNTCLELP